MIQVLKMKLLILYLFHGFDILIFVDFEDMHIYCLFHVVLKVWGSQILLAKILLDFL